MSETKHTPGPWIWGNEYRGLYGAGPNNEVLTHESYEGMWLSYGAGREANARLIAAAPDMLEALRYAETRCVSEAAYPHASIEDRKMRDLIVAAIAKASGAQP